MEMWHTGLRNWIEDLRTLLNASQTLWRTGWLALLLLHSSATARPPPQSIEEMRAREHVARLEPVRPLLGGPGFDARLVSYLSSGLKIHALVATPRTGRPARGFPVLVANHGHHPDPPRYGLTAQGLDARPGDYYRRIPELYASLGFLVVMPDYRGHGDSEGLEFTDGMLESLYYTEDVLALLAGLEDLPNADPENLFMWGHSMGGEVTLRALLATDRVRGASLWSTVGGDIWDQAFYYSRYEDDLAPDSWPSAQAGCRWSQAGHRRPRRAIRLVRQRTAPAPALPHHPAHTASRTGGQGRTV